VASREFTKIGIVPKTDCFRLAALVLSAGAKLFQIGLYAAWCDRNAHLCADECTSSNERRKTVQVPSQLKPGLWGAAGGAIVVAILGFTWGGWMTAGAADKLANERADLAVVAVLTPICVESFRQNGNATANLAALKNLPSTWEQGDFLEKGGWATRPGGTSPDYVLARACAEKLVQAKSAGQ
jgi:hypothetical protein